MKKNHKRKSDNSPKGPLEIIGLVIKIVAGISAIFGVVFGGYKYFEQKDLAATEKARERVLALESEYKEKDSLDEISKVWRKHHEEFVNILQNEDMSQPEIEQANFTLVNRVIKDNNLEDKIENLMDFFQGVAKCVKSNLCEEALANYYFGKDGKTIFRQFYPFICHIRKRREDDTKFSEFEEIFNPLTYKKPCPQLG